MLKKLAYIFLGLGFVLYGISQYIGVTIDENGVLHEPFGFIALSCLSITLGLVLGILRIISHHIAKADDTD
ncbi:MAG: DUF3955 domain-containing protein [Desulfovibrio sp.]